WRGGGGGCSRGGGGGGGGGGWGGGSAAAARGGWTWPASRSAVERSNSSVLYSSSPCRPSFSSVSRSVRSNLDVPLSMADGTASRPDSTRVSVGAFCSTNMTWKRGVRLGSRCG